MATFDTPTQASTLNQRLHELNKKLKSPLSKLSRSVDVGALLTLQARDFRNMSAISKEVENSGNAARITRNGKPDGLYLSEGMYQSLLELIRLGADISIAISAHELQELDNEYDNLLARLVSQNSQMGVESMRLTSDDEISSFFRTGKTE